MNRITGSLSNHADIMPAEPHPNVIAMARSVCAVIFMPVGWFVLCLIATNGFMITDFTSVGRVSNHGQVRIIDTPFWWVMAVLEITVPLWPLLCADVNMNRRFWPTRCAGRWRHLQWPLVALSFGPFVLAVLLPIISAIF